MSSDHSAAHPSLASGAGSAAARVWRAVRSVTFFLFYFLIYLIVVVEIPTRLVFWPIVRLFPARRRAVMGRWVRLHAHGSLGVARWLAGVRVSIRGPRIPPGPVVIVMNHQSVFDIPIGIALAPPPYPVIPTRERYRRGLPGVSVLLRLARYPFVGKGEHARRQELVDIGHAAEAVARGEQSLLIFPEGHRTRDGQILPFMRSGLRIILGRAKHPIYCVVGDGMWRSRTFADALLRFAGTEVRVAVLGPFDPPESRDPQRLDAFMDELRDEMIRALADLRRSA